MAEIKTKPTKASVKKYLNAIENTERKKDCITIVKIMEKETGKKPVMWGDSLVGFDKVQMAYSTGRKVDWIKVGFSSRKNAISLYLTCDLNEYNNMLKNLGTYKRGVGCLYIKKLSDINIKVLQKIIKVAVKTNN